jgi:hypothetical protein
MKESATQQLEIMNELAEHGSALHELAKLLSDAASDMMKLGVSMPGAGNGPNRSDIASDDTATKHTSENY